MRRRMFALLGLLVFCLSVSPAWAQDASDTWRPLIEVADGVTKRMLDACEDERYIQVFTSAGQLNDAVNAALAFDYTQPSHHVILTLKEGGIEQVWQMIGGEKPTEAVREALEQKLAMGLINMINSRQGSIWLAASSMMSVSDAALLPDIPAGSYLVFTVFGNDAPLLGASVRVKQGGLALVNATLARVDEAQRALLLDETITDLSALTGDAADPMAHCLLDGIAHSVLAAGK